jgi:hypothetical protein
MTVALQTYVAMAVALRVSFQPIGMALLGAANGRVAAMSWRVAAAARGGRCRQRAGGVTGDPEARKSTTGAG